MAQKRTPRPNQMVTGKAKSSTSDRKVHKEEWVLMGHQSSEKAAALHVPGSSRVIALVDGQNTPQTHEQDSIFGHPKDPKKSCGAHTYT